MKFARRPSSPATITCLSQGLCLTKSRLCPLPSSGQGREIALDDDGGHRVATDDGVRDLPVLLGDRLQKNRKPRCLPSSDGVGRRG